MEDNKRRPLLVQAFSFGYVVLFSVMTSGSVFLTIFAFSAGEAGVGLLGVVASIFFGMPFYIKANDQMLENAKKVGPLLGNPHEVAKNAIDSVRGFGYLALAIVIAVLVALIIGSVIGWIASLPIGFLLSMIILILVFKS